jgi:hypothetical protein
MAQHAVWFEAEHPDPRPGERGSRLGQPRQEITLHPYQHEINAAVQATSSIVNLWSRERGEESPLRWRLA